MASLLFHFISLAILATRSVGQITPPLIVFGDSTVDTGNNNYINTTADFSANFEPYGQQYPGKPTGRFSNGRVFVDFLCEFAGRPHLKPYLEPGADHSKGVNFASGGSGVLDDTNPGLVIPLKSQLKNFAEFKDGLNEKWGSELANKYFSDAVYVVSHGNNDYMGNYFARPEMQEKYTPQEFLGLVVSEIVKACEFLYSNGARTIVMVGVGPLGCIPVLRQILPGQTCYEPGTQLAFAHNMALGMALKEWGSQRPEVTMVVTEFLSYMTARQDNPTAFGFTNGAEACCGTTAPCGRTDPKTGADYTLCSNADQYVYWDGFHGSEKLSQGFAEEIWDGADAAKYISPMNLRTLFERLSSKTEELAELETYAGGSIKTLDQIDHTVG